MEWADVTVSQCYTLMLSCYNLMLQRYMLMLRRYTLMLHCYTVTVTVYPPTFVHDGVTLHVCTQLYKGVHRCIHKRTKHPTKSYIIFSIILFFFSKLLGNIGEFFDYLQTSWPTFQIPDFFQTFQIFQTCRDTMR